MKRVKTIKFGNRTDVNTPERTRQKTIQCLFDKSYHIYTYIALNLLAHRIY